MESTSGPPLLPYDVLLRIASFCSQSALAGLTAANRDLYDACVLLLLDHPVEIRDSKSITSLLDFLNADNDARWPRLHALIFGKNGLDREAAVRLSNHLPLASSLKYLEFRHAERTLSSDPKLGAVLAGLQTIAEVVIRHVGPRGAELLSTMRWNLERATLADLIGSGSTVASDGSAEGPLRSDQDKEDDDHSDEGEDDADDEDEDESDDDEPKRYDAPNLLFRAQFTLKELKLHNWRNRDVHFGIQPNFRELHTLTFSTSDVFYPRTIPWVWSFGGLWDLDVKIGRNRADPLAAAEVGEVEQARRENLEGQMRESWAHGLRSFRGSALDFYALGIPCTIYRLELELYAEDMRFVPAILETARPTILLLTMQDDMQLSEVTKIFALKGIEELGGVVYSNDSIKVPDDPQVAVDDILDALLSVIAPLPDMQVIRVSLGLVDASTDSAAGGKGDRIDSYVNAIDAEKLSTRIFESAPALGTAMLQLSWSNGSIHCERSIQMTKGGEIVIT